MRKFLLALCLGLFTFVPAHSQFSTAGTDFWFGFLENFSSTQIDGQLYLTSPVNTTCTVTLANGSYSQNFNITANVLLNVTIPAFNNPLVIQDQVVQNQAIHITSALPITVYAANVENATVDATVIYPTTSIGNDYRVAVYNPSNLAGSAAEFLIVAAENNTQVEITPSAATLQGNAAGTPFTIMLQQGQTYMVQSNGDLTGSTVKATGGMATCKKFAVFGGNQCASIPNVGAQFVCCCDHLYEQIPDVNRWGKNFVISPLTTRIGDTYTITAHTNGTVVNVSGVGVYNLNAGQFVEFITPGPAKWITSNNPVLVAQYANSQDYDFCAGADPFYIIIPPVEQATTDAIFGAYAMPLTTNYYLNVVTKTVNIAGGVVLDGVPIPAASYQPVTGNPAWSFAPITILAGSHVLHCDTGFIATTYGFGQYESYGYLAGANLIDLLAQPQVVFSGDTSVFSSFNDTLDCQDQYVFCFLDSNNTTVTQVAWNFGDGPQVIPGWSAGHTYTNPGQYMVTMWYMLPGGCNLDSVTFPVNFVASVAVLDLIHDTTVCPGDSITWMIPTGGMGTITWWDNTNDTVKTVPAGYYTVAYDSQGGCHITDSATVTEIIPNQAGLPNDTSICFPDTIVLSVNPLGISYTWQDNSTNPTFTATGPGTYFVHVDYGNCASDDTVNILDFQLFTVDLGNDTNICQGDQVILDAGIPGANYLWSTNAVTQTINVTTTGNYWVEVSVNTCVEGDTVNVVVTAPPAFSLGPDFEICDGDSALLDATLPNASAYLWNNGLGTLPSGYIYNAGTYIAQVTVPPCFVEDTIVVGLKVVINDILPDSVWFCQDENIEITADLNNAVYAWSNGSNSQTVTFDETQTASIIVYISGCTAKDTVDIHELTCYCNLFVPNSFTPNGDEKNEIFKPVICPELDYYTLTIYNRWGQEIFRTSDPAKGWDGKHGGKESPLGVYTYMVVYDSWAVFENEKTVRGQVNLIR